MAHITRLADAVINRPTLVTIGVYDGVHLGHQALIRRLIQRAQSQQLQSVVITFFPHPDRVVNHVEGRYYLMHPDQRAEHLLKLGVDIVITLQFDESLRQLPAADFVQNLVTHLQLRELWVGHDFALGYQRQGDVTYLREEGAQRGFDVFTIDLVTDEDQGKIITSTLIRSLIENGDVATAKSLLGHCFAIQGEVQHGDKRGRTIGFPTANIGAWSEQLMPHNGVYAGWIIVDGERYAAVTNIGVRPTFEGKQVTVEAHILNFNRDIYGQSVTLELETFLRPEQKFDGIQSLMTQLQTDIARGQAILEGLNQ